MARPTKKAPPKIPNEIRNEASQMVKNGLTEAILGFNPGSMGVQLSQVDTLFRNNRWYLVSNMRQLLNEIYAEHGIIQTVIDVPVDDGLRGGVEIQSKILDEDDLQKLTTIMEREGDMKIMGQALKWNRLFGGAGVLIMTDQDPKTPFDQAKLKEDSPLEFRAVDMWELYWTKQNTSDYASVIDSANPEVEFYDYYGQKVHSSRVMVMKGIEAPSFIRPRLRGWGLSVVEALVRSINQYLKSTDLVFEVLDEFKIDIFKIKNLANTLLQSGGTEIIQKRVQLANLQKNYQNALTMDSEDGYDQKELSFTGIAETMQSIRMQIASDLRMPLTKIFGISATGFSSGEDDIENYNCMIESQVREKCKFDILKMIEIRCQQEFGKIPDDLSINFKPLRILSSEQEENVKTNKYNRLIQCFQVGLMSALEFKQAINKQNLLGVQLDTTTDVLEVPGQEDGADTTDGGSGVDGGAPIVGNKDKRDKRSATEPKTAKDAKS